MKLKLVSLVSVGVLLLVFFIWVFVTNVFFKNPSSPNVPTKNFDIDYSNLYKLVPGKSKTEEVLKYGGTPVSQKTVDEKTYLYFNTPSEDYKNVVVLKGDVVFYVLENIFGKYRGSFANYESKYGNPDITFSEETVDFPWYIYLKNGIGVQSSANAITALLYFTPQSEKEFYDEIGVDFGIHGISPTPTGIPPDAGPPPEEFIPEP